MSKQDRLIWRDSVIGVFSVKSAYYEARKVLNKEEVNRDHRDKIWRWIWTAKVAPKVKYFLWRVLHRFILTRTRLQKNGIQGDISYAVRGR